MLRHVVMWKFKESAEGKSREENAIIMKEHIERLSKIIPQIKRSEVGINIKDDDCAFDAVLISDFENKEDLDIYIKHPEHLLVSSYCKKVRSDRRVVDYYL